jgi:O-antigen/teichoic acid export membrane protein
MTAWSAHRVRVEAQSFASAGLDQVLSSLSNVIVSLGVVRATGTVGLGRYTVAFSIYLIVLGFNRALIAEPFLTTPRSGSHDIDGAQARNALGSSLVFATGCALPIALLGSVWHTQTLLVLAMSLPFLCGQDLLRYVAMWRLEPSEACILDGAWVLVSLVAFPFLRSVSIGSAVGLWALGSAVGLFIGIRRMGLRPAGPRSSFAWWTANGRRLGGYLAIESVAYTASTQLIIIAIAITVGEGALGALRSAQIVLAPASLLVVAFNFFSLPRFVEHRPTPRIVFLAMSGAGLIALLVTTATLALPHSLIARVLSAKGAWSIALALPLSLQVVFSTMGAVGVASLKASRRGGLILTIRVVAVVLGTPPILWLAATFGVVAAAWGMAALTMLHAVLTAAALVHAVRSDGSDRDAAPAELSYPTVAAH